MRVSFCTLGCKLNQAETESLVGQFSRAGFQIVSSSREADICIANTCTVTHIADRKSRHWLRLARHRNPQALIIAIGCYARRNRQELAQLADLVIDNTDKENLLEIVTSSSLPTRFPVPNRIPLRHCDRPPGTASAREVISPIITTVRTRSLIKIQDGCHSPCMYCIVPKVRSHEYSVPSSQIIDEVQQKVTMGYKEVVLTGTKVGSYRHDGTDFRDLVQHILSDTRIERLRVSSLQPSEISSELLTLWQDERLCPHFHLALQSGSEIVLQRMKRSYSLEQYRRTMNLVRENIPDAAITTDIMVGFPGETDEEFERSYSFCQQAGFANIHVFPFSPRPETAAARMPQQIRDEVKQERKQRMLELSRDSWRRFREQFPGRTVPVLWEQEIRPGSRLYSGLTGNYIRVFAHSEKPVDNELKPLRLLELRNEGIWGEIVDENPD
jgi:threonylcarbamoyladenosine tRNA methylthiotransferase MtaB